MAFVKRIAGATALGVAMLTGYGLSAPGQITRNASTNLPTFNSIYQRHTGVLDKLP